MAWTRMACVDDIEQDEAVSVDVAGRKYAVYATEGEFFVSDGICTHAYALLSDGYIEDGCIECPLHQARFDLKTGKALSAPATQDIGVYPVKIEGQDVFADLPEVS